MISNFFKKEVSKENINDKDKLIKITALLIHAAKVDENYSDNEKAIISNFLKSSNKDIDVNSIIKKVLNK